VKRSEKIGIIIAFAGVATILIDRGRMLVGEGGEGYGNAIILCAVVAAAVNTVLIAPVLRRHGAVVVIGWYYIIGTILALPILVQSLPVISAWSLTRSEIIEVGYILILGSSLPMYLLYKGSEHLTATHNAVYRYIQPIIATILAVSRGQAIIDRTNIVGAVLIFVGMLCVIFATPRNEVTRE
jgi:drug/metabolite transporter (DMT)-like permease